jgi:membrane-bound lytic murein transglycosylase D
MKKQNQPSRPNRFFIASATFLTTFYVFQIENNTDFCTSGCVDIPVQSHFLQDNPVDINENKTRPEFKIMPMEQLVQDLEGRVNDSFSIPSGLENRVGFWVKVYSEHDSAKKIIHHLDYPWITYEIFDVSSILEAPSRFKWTNPEKAEKATNQQLFNVKLKLTSLYKKLKKNRGKDLGDLSQLDSDQLKYLKLLEEIPGSLVQNVKAAASRIRVQTGQRDFFQKGLGIAGKYFPHMEEILVNHGLPPEISRLPLVESSFNWTATSKVGAAGLWQFMDNTGKKFLTINSYIDERNSPFKSTEAAAELIKENYMIMGRSWPLAITAWNHGPTGLKKAIKKLGTKDIVKIIKHFQSRNFSFASENFYSEFLAALYVEKYSDKVFEALTSELAVVFESHTLIQRLKPSQIFKAANITPEEFVSLNPDLKKAVKFNLPLPRGLIIYLHPDRIQDLVQFSSQRSARGRPI